MKRIAFVVDSNFKHELLARLVSSCVQYSMSTDAYTGDVCISLPRAKGIRFLSELRRASVPYELV